MRTDLSSEIDGALATRNLGSRHYSDIARSGNGNMLSDLAEEELGDYEELDGIGESFEELSLAESNAVAGLGGGLGTVLRPFRTLRAGEHPPFAAKRGKMWMRKRIALQQRKPGGGVIARVKWAQMTPGKLKKLAAEGQVAGMGEFSVGMIGTLGIAAGAGALLWFVMARKG